MLRFIALRGERAQKNRAIFTIQVKRYIDGSKPCCRAFITFGKQTMWRLNTTTCIRYYYV